MPKESTIVRSILDELRLRGSAVWFRKNHGGPFSTAGVPDIEVIFRRGAHEPAIVVFLEVKRPGGEPTKLQNATMDSILRAGGFAFVVTSREEALLILNRIGLPPKVPPT